MDKLVWSQLLEDHIKKLTSITDYAVLSIILNDSQLMTFIADFFTPPHLAYLNALYGHPTWVFENYMKNYNNVCVPYLEGHASDQLVWPDFKSTYPTDTIILNYLVYTDDIDSLYELSLIQKHLNMTFQNISIKCIIDNRTKPFTKGSRYSIESRANITPESVIVVPK